MSIDNQVVEGLASSLVREYLSRKGLSNTLKTMDSEFPRMKHSVNNRIALAKEMHLEGLLKRNKIQEQPLSTMIEVIVKHIKETSRPRTKSSEYDSSPSEDKIVKKQAQTTTNKSLTQAFNRINANKTDDPKCTEIMDIESIDLDNNAKNNSNTAVTSLIKCDSDTSQTSATIADTAHLTGINSAHDRKDDAITSSPITLEVAIDLKQLIFGKSNAMFNYEWRLQSFFFSDVEILQYGILQKKGGTCGIIAAIQAHFLKSLIFSDSEFEGSQMRFSNIDESTQKRHLTSAIAETLWRAGSYCCAVVTLPKRSAHFQGNDKFRLDQLTEKLVLHKVLSLESLKKLLIENLHQFQDPKGNGCILYLYSLLLSRSIDSVRQDMDDPAGHLMGAYNYCSQEMVNLIITGKAISNVFDGIVELSGDDESKYRLNGIESQCQVGLLSLLENYGACKVGDNLKSPKYPIWIIYSESHYSVVFSLNQEILNISDIPDVFDLYYYDSLGNQDEEIRLTIDPHDQIETNEKDLVPPLDLCIRTRWPGAFVDWNGTEPLL